MTNTIKPGEIIRIGNKIYARCLGCDQLIRVDKPIFGSLHFCEPS